MSPLEALEAARAAGVEVRLDGKDLIVSSAGEPPAEILALLSGHKAAIVEYLRGDPLLVTKQPAAPPPPPPAVQPREWPREWPRGWSAAEWRLFHNDRQLVAELALGKTRQQARAYALRCCVEKWRQQRPGSSEAEAIAALAKLGIAPSPLPPTPGREAAQ